MSDFKAKMHQIVCHLGLCPRPRWGSLQCSPLPQGPSWILGGLLLREGREGEGEEAPWSLVTLPITTFWIKAWWPRVSCAVYTLASGGKVTCETMGLAKYLRGDIARWRWRNTSALWATIDVHLLSAPPPRLPLAIYRLSNCRLISDRRYPSSRK